jgi:hypothetical protein
MKFGQVRKSVSPSCQRGELRAHGPAVGAVDFKLPARIWTQLIMPTAERLLIKPQARALTDQKPHLPDGKKLIQQVLWYSLPGRLIDKDIDSKWRHADRPAAGSAAVAIIKDWQ